MSSLTIGTQTASELIVVTDLREGGLVGNYCYAAVSAAYAAGTCLMRNSSSADILQPWDGTTNGTKPVAGILAVGATLNTTPTIYGVYKAGSTFNNEKVLVSGTAVSTAEQVYLESLGFHMAGGYHT